MLSSAHCSPFSSGPLGQLANGTLGPRPPGGGQPESRLVTQRPRPRACRAARCVSENREAFRLLETDRWMDSLTTVLLGPGGTRLDGGRAALQFGGWESAESGSTLRPWMQIAPQEAVPSGLSEAQWPQGGGTQGLSHLLALISQTQQQPHPPRKGDGQRPPPGPAPGSSRAALRHSWCLDQLIGSPFCGSGDCAVS